MYNYSALPTPRPGSTLKTLFFRYLSGQIRESSWTAFMAAFDSNGTTPEEREAFARFYDDALGEVGLNSIRMPRHDEVLEILKVTRSS